MSSPERDVEAGDLPRRPRSSIPSILFVSFVLFMLTNHHGDDLTTKMQYIDALQILTWQSANYSSWLAGNSSDFKLPDKDASERPLVESFIQFGSRLEPTQASYYSNLTGFWRGDLTLHNITYLPEVENPPEWYRLASDYIAGGNLTNSTEVAERLGPWNWTASDKVAISIGDKLIYSEPHLTNVSKDISIIHGKVDLTDPKSSEELRLDFDGVHFMSNGSIYAFAEPNGQHTDIRLLPLFAPEDRMNETAGVVDAELRSHISRLKEKIESGDIESGSEDDDGPKTKCSFALFGQLEPSYVPQHLMKELEDEIDNPTGISTITPPPLLMKGVLLSKNCGMLFEFDTTGLKSQSLYRKITTYAGFAAIANTVLLVLLTRQVTRSSSAVGLARVSRHPFLAQSLIDAVSFVGHITLGILADGRPSIAVLAPAGFACLLFVREAQFSVLIGQIQGPEDMATPTPAPSSQPAPSPQPTSRPSRPDSTSDTSVETPSNTSSGTTEDRSPQLPTTVPPVIVTPPPPTQMPTVPPPQRMGLLRFLFHHIRTDPSARLWTLMSFFLIVVFRLVVILSLPLLFIGSLYAFMWLPQIYRAVKRGRSSGLHPEYVIGATLCRLYYLLYFLACPKNILDVEPRRWVWLIALIMAVQVAVILMQDLFGPTFFLPQRFVKTTAYDYHPPLPLPDPEAPEQSLGDCAICMDAIEVDPAIRPGMDDEKGHMLAKTGGLWAKAGARKSYSLAPCHHLFHTACLERWLTIKNICPQCRRPLPPL
ncbi:hypothetical protein K474DRAFT_1607089 [Panus rudis PR-1116 ss-1]|nr:hypothetical protein K474DRAFT_1607089 [Panus rudis PR-1116 ss-1]